MIVKSFNISKSHKLKFVSETISSILEVSRLSDAVDRVLVFFSLLNDLIKGASAGSNQAQEGRRALGNLAGEFGMGLQTVI